MNKNDYCVFSWIVGIALIIGLSGCSTSRVSLSDRGYVAVEKQDSEKIKILWTDVYQEDGQTWIYGVLKQPSVIGGTIKTHVDIQILNPDGSVQLETVSKEIYVPRNRIGKGPDWKRFRVKLGVDVQEGSKAFIKVHSGNDECFKEMVLLSNSH